MGQPTDTKNTVASAIDQILDAAEQDGTNPLVIHAMIHEHRRKRAHAKAKVQQPALGLATASQGLRQGGFPDTITELRTFWRSPLTPEDADASAGAMDYLLQTLDETMDAGDVDDAIFAALRVARKAWAWNPHLGPIEGTPGA
jgi:hypothetical protein